MQCNDQFDACTTRCTARLTCAVNKKPFQPLQQSTSRFSPLYSSCCLPFALQLLVRLDKSTDEYIHLLLCSADGCCCIQVGMRIACCMTAIILKCDTLNGLLLATSQHTRPRHVPAKAWPYMRQTGRGAASNMRKQSFISVQRMF